MKTKRISFTITKNHIKCDKTTNPAMQSMFDTFTKWHAVTLEDNERIMEVEVFTKKSCVYKRYLIPHKMKKLMDDFESGKRVKPTRIYLREAK